MNKQERELLAEKLEMETEKATQGFYSAMENQRMELYLEELKPSFLEKLKNLFK